MNILTLTKETESLNFITTTLGIAIVTTIIFGGIIARWVVFRTSEEGEQNELSKNFHLTNHEVGNISWNRTYYPDPSEGKHLIQTTITSPPGLDPIFPPIQITTATGSDAMDPVINYFHNFQNVIPYHNNLAQTLKLNFTNYPSIADRSETLADIITQSIDHQCTDLRFLRFRTLLLHNLNSTVLSSFDFSSIYVNFDGLVSQSTCASICTSFSAILGIATYNLVSSQIQYGVTANPDITRIAQKICHFWKSYKIYIQYLSLNCLALTDFLLEKFKSNFQEVNIDGVRCNIIDVINKLRFNAKFWVQDFPFFTDEFQNDEAIIQAKKAWLENVRPGNTNISE